MSTLKKYINDNNILCRCMLYYFTYSFQSNNIILIFEFFKIYIPILLLLS